MPKKKSSTKKIIIVVALIAIIGVGLYLGLAYPFPVLSQPINISGLSAQTFTVAILFPNTQMQVTIELTSASALWSYVIKDSSGNTVYSQSGLSTSPGSYGSPWLTASGVYNITVTCFGTMTGHLIVTARGPPFVT